MRLNVTEIIKARMACISTESLRGRITKPKGDTAQSEGETLLRVPSADVPRRDQAPRFHMF
jgi:hypothetical protein